MVCQEIYPFVSSVKINSLKNFCQWSISKFPWKFLSVKYFYDSFTKNVDAGLSVFINDFQLRTEITFSLCEKLHTLD